MMLLPMQMEISVMLGNGLYNRAYDDAPVI